ncbi:MAG TPA: methyltransferase domain-containing protein, partial [Candidatus Binatus sp.]|nr:methyltransferase domain-containing protein [Candidatus Binatus sp.]
HEAYGVDFGQNSWVTDDEFKEFLKWLHVDAQSSVLDIASGSGGPALHLATILGCQVTGLEINEHGVASAREMAKAQNLDSHVSFRQGDASQPLPFGEEVFDGIICIDAINHLPYRDQIFAEWYRVLKPGGCAVFTDPIIVTGLLTSEEVAIRTGIGYFLLSSPGEDERLLKKTGFKLVHKKDVTENVGSVAKRRHDARAKFVDELVKLESKEGFEQAQRFFQVAEKVARERRLSRFAFAAEKSI